LRRADNLTTFMCPLSLNLGASTSWNPQGLSTPVMGLLYRFTYRITNVSLSMYFLEISVPNDDIKSMILRIATPCSLIDDISYSNGPVASIFSADNKKTVAIVSPVTFVPPGGTTQHDN